MRPPGEARLALLKAAVELTTVTRSPTVRELAARACVGREAALHIVRHMRREGLLVIKRTRRVDYRNRPVAEYAPAESAAEPEASELGRVLASWVGGGVNAG